MSGHEWTYLDIGEVVDANDEDLTIATLPEPNDEIGDLLAAAPDLLEAARFDHVLQTEGYTLKAATMLGLADEYSMHGGTWLATQAREKRAAAISKATGAA